MSLDITALSQEDLAVLRQAIFSGGGLDALGRSPIKARQLQNLNLKPTATDPRPDFHWSAESPRDIGDLTKTTPYPRLMWARDTGTEIAVHDDKTQLLRLSEGYLLTPPANAEAPKPFDVVAAQLESLTEKDRQMLAKSYQQARLEKIQASLADLPDDQIAALLERMNAPTEQTKGAR